MTTRPPLFTRRRLAMSVLLAVAFAGVAVAFTLHNEPAPVVYTNPAVRTVYPKPGEQVLRQTSVFVELEPGYTTRAISFEGTAVGPPDLDVIEGLNRYGYTPGEGKVIGRFDPGRMCPVVEITDLSRPDADPVPFSWCFSLS